MSQIELRSEDEFNRQIVSSTALRLENADCVLFRSSYQIVVMDLHIFKLLALVVETALAAHVRRRYASSFCLLAQKDELSINPLIAVQIILRTMSELSDWPVAGEYNRT